MATTRTQLSHALILIGGSLLWHSHTGLAAEHQPPALMLANAFEDADIDLADYWVSEKYDGVRAYWDGEKLLTRNGNQIAAPEWFTSGWPRNPMDGELWIGRGMFEAVVSTVRDEEPDDAAWRRVRFMVFDLPAHPGVFDERLATLTSLLSKSFVPWIEAVPHFKLSDQAALEIELQRIVAEGGEGLMLHRGSSSYHAERSDDLLKLKTYADAEARVIAHLPGKGKYQGMLGALLVQRPDGMRFRIGTGFTDEQRRRPPRIGSWITYSYQNLTAQGVPRFARFMRIRDDAPPSSDRARVDGHCESDCRPQR